MQDNVKSFLLLHNYLTFLEARSIKSSRNYFKETQRIELKKKM